MNVEFTVKIGNGYDLVMIRCMLPKDWLDAVEEDWRLEPQHVRDKYTYNQYVAEAFEADFYITDIRVTDD